MQGTGLEGPATAEFEWNVAFASGGRITWSYRPVIRTSRGDQKGATIAGTSGLGEAWRTENGYAMWQFRDGELKFVRSYQSGAMRLIFAAKRDGPDLRCVATNVFTREGNKQDLIINSPVEGAPVTISTWKQSSSNCEVTPRSAGFDGLRQTTVVCDKQGNVERWSHQLIGQVKNNLYHGELGEQGKPGWASYDGTIEREGSVRIIHTGLTGSSAGTLGHVQPGTKLSWPFTGRI